ncbi:aminotransferase class V-fold PLP-dependent enzyme [Candidatus Woesearchaeota archaeon]|jgi:cysteine desulfurase|nr:aminotransferase class V-fold PLP-dependent enzyme [Candidatus Woesearchaeota archaeon]MBT7238149.1 aminotransferase class V-fold PLP-dependent enzyme [Candidatus Woesearchaeota archaeon]
MTIYLDASASTKIDNEVLIEMRPFIEEEYGNAGSMHTSGLKAAHALNLSRKKIKEILNVDEVIFTSSGTESINLALKGYALKNKSKGNHIITTKIEHHAVLDTLEYLEKNGFEITYLDVEENGIINPKKIKEAIKENTILISVMHANNEIGTIQPIKEISKIAKGNNIIFHTDACQAGNSESLKDLDVDMLSLNGSKIYGPKGIGILCKKNSIRLEPLIHGGGQENKLRSGTENIPNIIGLAKALDIAQNNIGEYKKLSTLRDYFIQELLKIENTILNGDKNNRLPNNVNITFLNVEGEAILLMLDEKGIQASSGSACTSNSLDPSHVILALGMPYEAAHGSIRFTLTKDTTKEDINYVLKEIPEIIKKLRGISPVNLTLEEIKNV